MAGGMSGEVDVGRLTAAMRRGRLALRVFRERRTEMVRQYAGRWWGEEGAARPVPVNLLGQYVTVVGRSLIAKTPRVMLSTFRGEYKPTVAAMERWVNQAVARMELAAVLQRVVVDALFCVGIAKVGLATPADAADAGWSRGAGLPFCERVDLDDFVYDIHARDFSEAGFIGHRYRVPLAAVRDDESYSAAGRAALAASVDSQFNAEGDERATTMGPGYYLNNGEEYEDMVDLWEVYLPRRRLVVTLAVGDAGGNPLEGEPLRVQEWLGPGSGPYHILAYNWVPGNAMPKGPVLDLYDLHESVNRNFRKLQAGADRAKENTFVRGGADEDGNRVMNSSDGDIVRVDNPEAIGHVKMGGPSSEVFAFMQASKDLFSWLAGNLDIMGGLSPQAKTAAQDKMLNENSSRAVSDMQATTVGHASAVMRALCWYWWHDPVSVARVTHEVRGVPEAALQRAVTPQARRRVPFEELEVAVDPYSLAHATPQARAAALTGLVTQVVAPLMPLLQQQGLYFDMGEFLAKIGKYTDQPDLQEIVTIRPPPEGGAGGGGGGGGPGVGMPTATTRNYVRESRPGRTDAGTNKTLVPQLLGVDLGGASEGGGG